ISAIGLGLMMVSFESLISAWIYHRKPESHLIAKLGKAAIWVLSIYLLVRLGDIMVEGKTAMIFTLSRESILFITELLIMAIIPLILFAVPRTRHSLAGQWIGSAMVVFGAIFNRVNVGGLTMTGVTGDSYFPSWMEFSISFAIVAFMMIVFLFAVEKFHIWDKRPVETESAPHARPSFSRAGEVWLGAPGVAGRTKYSLAFILAMALGFALLPGSRLHSDGIEQVVSQRARGGDTLYVDGNRDGYGVEFAHAVHVDSLGGEQSCVQCHHMNQPMDQTSGCYTCHSRMYIAADAFRHDWHAAHDGGNIPCNDCHAADQNRTVSSAKTCDKCHKDLIPAGATIEVKNYMAASYVNAMHTQCVGCHRTKAAESPERAAMAECAACHTGHGPDYLQAEALDILRHPQYNRVVMPGLSLVEEPK
ncbi:MAG: hypothetical protein KKA81_16300, partial [Bacteroidetes bacterium]|nr:hypothetical protein [Bacteroidota bacterium]